MTQDNNSPLNSMIPPEEANFVGGGDFEQVGLEFRRHFIEYGNLQSHHKVLDVGCGQGRMAIPLTQYLNQQGGYWGIDIVKSGIEWCQSKISSRFDHFHFHHTNVFNSHYNPEGRIPARIYRFPFDDNSFDFVFLTSVFTHMFPQDLANYAREIARVVKPDGNCFITFFVLNEESEKLMKLPGSDLNFTVNLGECYTADRDNPAIAIAYQESKIVEIFSQCGLLIEQPVHYGNWCARSEFLTYQDVIIAKKFSKQM